MAKTNHLFLLAFGLILSSFIYGQKNDAAKAFDAKDFRKAYELYDKLYTESPKNLEYKFRLGYSALFYPEKKARAIEIFEDLKKTDSSPDMDYYLAKAYHSNYRFDDAIAAYNVFIKAKEGVENPTDEDKLFLYEEN